MISSYKHMCGASFSFGGVKKDSSIYFIKPEGKRFIQSPCIVARDSLVSDETNALSSSAALVVPSRFTTWVKSMERDLIEYAVANKADLFAKDLSDDFIRSAFRSSAEANVWRVNVHPDVSVFDKEKNLVTASSVTEGSRVVCLFTLNSVRFTRKAFYAKWVLRSVRVCGSPEYQFLDEDDDFTPAHSIVDDDGEADDADALGESAGASCKPLAEDRMDSSDIQVPLPVEGGSNADTSPESGTTDTLIHMGEEAPDAHTDDEHPVDGPEAEAFQFIADSEEAAAAAAHACDGEVTDAAAAAGEEEVTAAAEDTEEEAATDNEQAADAPAEETAEEEDVKEEEEEEEEEEGATSAADDTAEEETTAEASNGASVDDPSTSTESDDTKGGTGEDGDPVAAPCDGEAVAAAEDGEGEEEIEIPIHE